MSIGELLTRLLAELKPLLPGVIVLIVATLVAMLSLFLNARYVWIQSKKFPLPSLFFGLNKTGVVCISCAWLKLIFPIVYIVSFQKLELIQYLVFVIPGLLLALLSGSFSKFLSKLLYLAMETAGVFSASLICGYITEMRADTWFILIYAAIGIFMILFAVYLFLQDLERISAMRKISADQVWRVAKNETE